jgi:hypothetical protein
MTICRPCSQAADDEQATVEIDPAFTPAGHPPEICRDHAIQPHGCPCAHRPVRSAS